MSDIKYRDLLQIPLPPVPPEGFVDEDRTASKPRSPGKHRVKPWPTAAEREWEIDRHEFQWELPDAAYDRFRDWAMRVEAGEAKAVALAAWRSISVMCRRPPGKRDFLMHPENVLFDISDAIHNDAFDDPDDEDMSREGYERRFELQMAIGQEIIEQIFGPDPGNLILLMTQHCYEGQGDPEYELGGQQERAEARLKLGIATKRDHEIFAQDPMDRYWA